jgi:LysR family nitrogen assimilation transcriptional regulator
VAVDPLAELDLLLVSPAQNLAPAARAQASIDFEQLRGLPLALPTRSHGLRRTLEHAAALEDTPLNVVFEMDALELMKEIVLEGLAHTVLGVPAVVRELACGQLVARRIVNPGLSTRLMLATASSRPLTQAVKIVQGILRELLASMASSEPYRAYMRMAG